MGHYDIILSLVDWLIQVEVISLIILPKFGLCSFSAQEQGGDDGGRNLIQAAKEY